MYLCLWYALQAPLQFIFVIMCHTYGTGVMYVTLSMFRLCQNAQFSDAVKPAGFTTPVLYASRILSSVLTS